MGASESVDCPFCRMPVARILAANEVAYAVRDAYPVSDGHSLVIPRRHVANFFELSLDEVGGVFRLLYTMQRELDKEKRPGGYNIGVNVGQDAGQTVMHCHVHLIPRFVGDVMDPTGGVRIVIPGKGSYFPTEPGKHSG